MDLDALATRLEEDPPGYWSAPAVDEVSYPEGGHTFTDQVVAESFWFRHRTACILAALEQLPPQGPVVDVGGGTGHVTSALADAGHDAVLVEPGPVGARSAWERGVRPVVNATTSTAGFGPDSLPNVGCFDVVEHIEDDRGFLSHLGELVAPGGRAYLTVPAHQWLWSVDDVRAGHHRRYSRRQLRAVLVATGWEVEFLTAFFRPLVLPVLLVRSIPSRLGLRDTEDRASAAREHTPPQLLTTIMDRVLAPEVGRIARGRPMPFGASLLAVARRA